MTRNEFIAQFVIHNVAPLGLTYTLDHAFRIADQLEASKAAPWLESQTTEEILFQLEREIQSEYTDPDSKEKTSPGC